MADFLSTVASMFRARQKGESQKQTKLGSRESRRYVKPTEKKKDTGKAFTNEEIYRIINASRLPIQQQKSYYEINPELKKKVKERTRVAYESRPALVGALEGLNPISGLNTLQGAVGDIDVSKTTKTAPYIVGNMLGQAGQYLMTGGLAQAGVAGTILKGSTGIGKKLAANAAADIITGVPLNVAESLKTAKTPEEFAKNFAVNTALDVGIGAAVGGAGAAIKALKANKATKVIADTLEKGNYTKEAKVAEVQMQQSIKNLTQRKLKAGSTIVQPTPEAQMVNTQVPSTTTQAIKNIQQRKLTAESALARDKGRQFVKLEDGSTSLKYTPTELQKLKKQNDYYKTGYVTSMTPDDFLALTTTKKLRGDFAEEIATSPKYKGGKLKKGSVDRDFMFIDVDPKTWNVIGHEGRHRMMLLKNSGINNVDVLVRFPKYEGNTVPFENIVLNPQKEGGKLFGEKSVTLKELAPLSGDLAEQTIAKYSAPTFQPKRLGSQPTQPTITPQANIQPQPLQPSTTVQPTTTVPSTQVQPKSIKGKSYQKNATMPNPTLLGKMPVEKKMNVLKEFLDDVRLRMVDIFTPQEDYARSLAKTNYQESRRLLGIINKARTAREAARNFITNAQVDFDGKRVGESLNEFMDRIPPEQEELFQEFTFLKHHIDRLAKGNPILNLNKADTMQRINDIMNSLSPSEKKLFNDTSLSMRTYIDNLRQYGVDTGLITQKQIDLFENMYPNYIKTARYKGNNTINIASGNPKLKQIVNKASRSDDPILPLKKQLEILTNDYVVTGNLNNMVRELAKSRNLMGKGTKQKLGNTLSVTNQIGSDGERNFMTFYDNGREYKLPISKLEAKSYKLLTQGGYGTEGTEKIIGDILNPANEWFKLPITGVNPIFMVKNFFRDFEDALFYTQDLKGFLQNYIPAYKELSTKGDFFQLYQATGGRYSTFSNLDKDLKDKATWFGRPVSKRIEDVNVYIEQIPRMTEFMNVLKKELKGMPLDTATGDMINKAALAAAEITTNFGRSGDIGKYLNRTGVPFLNPSIQGGSRIIRQLTGQDGFKGYMRLATKAATMGIIPAVINEMIYGDDPDYQQFNDREKLISFIFKIGDTWIKIPKGRLLSSMGMIPQGIVGQLKGDEYDFAEVFKVMRGQIAPVNAWESNLFTPFLQAVANKTWYGGEIDGQSWNDTKKTERYDETTSAIGKFLGGFGISTFGDTNINLSPRQWDYVIDGYTGIFGDTILPWLREDKTRRNPIKQAFTLDPVMQNDLSNNFYNLYNKTLEMSKEPTVDEQMSRRFITRYKAKADDVLEQINDIKTSDLTPEQKEEQTRELRIQLNNIYKNAEFELKEFQSFVDTSIAKYQDEEKGFQDAIIQAQVKNGADEWEAYTMFLDGKKKDNYALAKNVGVKPQSYYELFDGRLDVDGSGGIKQEEAQSVLDSMDFTNEQKAVLWNLIGSTWKSNPYTGTTASSGRSGGGSKTKSVATAYRNGLATKQVNALKNINIESPNLSSAEIKAIIKMLSA